MTLLFCEKTYCPFVNCFWPNTGQLHNPDGNFSNPDGCRSCCRAYIPHHSWVAKSPTKIMPALRWRKWRLLFHGKRLFILISYAWHYCYYMLLLICEDKDCFFIVFNFGRACMVRVQRCRQPGLSHSLWSVFRISLSTNLQSMKFFAWIMIMVVLVAAEEITEWAPFQVAVCLWFICGIVAYGFSLVKWRYHEPP